MMAKKWVVSNDGQKFGARSKRERLIRKTWLWKSTRVWSETKIVLGLLVCTVGCGGPVSPSVQIGPDRAEAPPTTVGFRCVTKPSIELPSDDSSDDERPVPSSGLLKTPQCAVGLVPHPVDVYAAKAHPPQLPAQFHAVSIYTSGIYWFYAGAWQDASSLLGAKAILSQFAPFLGESDYHTLSEISVESADGTQVVEVGWTVDRGQFGDTQPHLFVFHWVNGAPTCYNGCGWVQVSTTYWPGMTLPSNGSGAPFKILNVGGNWWIRYAGEWLGYFPSSLWGANFPQAGLAQWFGEVAASTPTTCTKMGSGAFGGHPGAATYTKMKIGLSSGFQPANIQGVTISQPAYYASVPLDSSDFAYGGPGACGG